ncbi:hypothetical protein HP548_02600 [Paenibacillus taichungensis]|uniref:Uncharacterized protein n=2 Tax=Paenibacillus taichungensis TaxID=484184 RepID=A0ABX2MDG2_9BACL|nr:hypothetical protein [Paenibacillus taichungensis]
MLNILQNLIMALPQLGATVVDGINTYTITRKPIQIELNFKSKHTVASVRITTPIHERSFTADESNPELLIMLNVVLDFIILDIEICNHQDIKEDVKIDHILDCIDQHKGKPTKDSYLKKKRLLQSHLDLKHVKRNHERNLNQSLNPLFHIRDLIYRKQLLLDDIYITKVDGCFRAYGATQSQFYGTGQSVPAAVENYKRLNKPIQNSSPFEFGELDESEFMEILVAPLLMGGLFND